MFKTPSGDAWLFALVCAAGSLAGCLHEWNITRRAAKRFYESSICADRIKYLVPSSVNMFGFEVKNWFLHGGRFFFLYVSTNRGIRTNSWIVTYSAKSFHAQL